MLWWGDVSDETIRIALDDAKFSAITPAKCRSFFYQVKSAFSSSGPAPVLWIMIPTNCSGFSTIIQDLKSRYWILDVIRYWIRDTFHLYQILLWTLSKKIILSVSLGSNHFEGWMGEEKVHLRVEGLLHRIEAMEKLCTVFRTHWRYAKLFEFVNEKGGTSEIISTMLIVTAEINYICDRIIGLCDNNCPINFDVFAIEIEFNLCFPGSSTPVERVVAKAKKGERYKCQFLIIQYAQFFLATKDRYFP